MVIRLIVIYGCALWWLTVKNKALKDVLKKLQCMTSAMRITLTTMDPLHKILPLDIIVRGEERIRASRLRINSWNTSQDHGKMDSEYMTPQYSFDKTFRILIEEKYTLEIYIDSLSCQNICN